MSLKTVDGNVMNDLIVSNVIRTHEMQVWFLAEHVVKKPAARAD